MADLCRDIVRLRRHMVYFLHPLYTSAGSLSPPTTKYTQSGNVIFWLYSITMENPPSLVRVGGGGARLPPPPITISTIMYKVVVYAPSQRADTFPLFLLYPYMYSLPPTHSPPSTVGQLNTHTSISDSFGNLLKRTGLSTLPYPVNHPSLTRKYDR